MKTKRNHARIINHKTLFASLGAGVLLLGAAFYYVTPDTNKYIEVGYTEQSPLGDSAGEVIPASCPSDLHDAPSNYGQACVSGANACGQTNSGTIQCDGSCSVGVPANPAGYGNACNSSANACGQTNAGTIQCNGSCSATTPANPVGYGNTCTGAANSCGTTNSGTLVCSGGSPTLYCSASTPAEPVLPATCGCASPPGNYGTGCSSGANACGFVNTGTIQCNGTCSATTPSDSLCSATCGNGVCDAHETAGSCSADCPGSGTPITGWGWSDNIGWISLNCSDVGTCATRNYALRKNTSNKIIGFAWSENVGWISANAADLSGCPSGTCEVSVSSLGRVSGWLKALNATSGWDGWISLNGTNYQTMLESDNVLSNWAWGSDVTGWILWSAQLSCAQTAGDFCSGNSWQHRHPNCTVTTIIADCGVSGCSSATNQCVSTPPPSVVSGLRATPQLVSPGGTSVITWNIQNAISCTVTGNGNSWTGTSGTQTTSPINTVSTYTLNCTGVGGNLTQTVVIKFAPKWQEK